jgi:hypothetical protein
MKTFVHLWLSRRIFCRMRNVSYDSCRENQNTRFTFNNFLPKTCCFWCYVEKCGRAGQDTGDIIRRMRIACCRHTHTHRIYNTSCFSTAIGFNTNAPQYLVLRHSTLPVVLLHAVPPLCTLVKTLYGFSYDCVTASFTNICRDIP